MSFKKSYRNTVGLSQPKLEELLKNLENLKEFGEDFFDRVVRYVLDGEDEAVLGELAGKKDAAHALSLLCSTESGIGHEELWGDFFNTVEPVDCRFYLRLGKVFESTATKLPTNRFFCQPWFENALWLEILLQEGTQTHARCWTSDQRKTAISGPLIENLLKAAGSIVDAFVTAAFRATEKKWDSTKTRDMLLSITNLGETFASHCNLIKPFLLDGIAANRQIAVENLARSGAPANPFIEELVACATDSSKLLRESAEPLVKSEREAARVFMEKAAVDLKSTQREQAVRLLARIYGVDSRQFLEERQSTEKNAAVKAAIVVALNEINSTKLSPPVEETPPRAPIALEVRFTSSLKECLRKAFEQYNEFALEHNQRYAALTQNQHIYPYHELAVVNLDPQEFSDTIRLLEQGGAVQGIFSQSMAYALNLILSSKGPFRMLFEHSDLQLIHLIRFLAMVRLLDPQFRHSGGMNWHASSLIDVYYRAHSPKITLLDLAEAIRTIGLHDDVVMRHILEMHIPVFCWESATVWPFIMSKIYMFEDALQPATGDWRTRWEHKQRFDNTLRILATLPMVPPSLIPKLWEMAIGTNKADRLRAQKIVIKLPDLPERLTQAISARAAETRAIVVEWIGRLGDRQYVAALHKAAKAEKVDAAIDAMLTALERLGEDVGTYLDRDKLLADAQKGLKKGIPPALEWFPWTLLPMVRWQDTDEEVSKEVITWLIVQHFKLKSPEAGPLLRRYCALMQPTDRTELGQFILGAWFDQDLKRKYTDAECRAKAQQQAQATWQSYQQVLQWYQKQGQSPPTTFLQTLPQVEESLFHGFQREVGTAVSEKGILAVAGACCDTSAVGPVQKYLKEWYGYRAAQCKALIATLSTIEHPSATQFLLSIANRFRTKGIREEAEKYVNALAERKGWTLDELADRTLPTAGFDDDGTLALSFGPRRIQLRITPSLEAVLSDPEGKTLKALPAPRKDDDEEQAKAAKKTFSAAKAELKKFAGLQTTRLYEAMCTQRNWPVADWRTYLMSHPLMKFLCQRLVWAAEMPTSSDAIPVSSEKPLTFRPLDDGTLTDFEDGEISLSPDAKLRIAHSCQLPAETASAWAAHLADYNVTPLFTQFGRAAYVLSDEKRKATAIEDFEGHLVEAFKLRSLATKLGYTRGQAQDGGWFFEYIKNFPGMGLKAVLNFSGNGLPEENRTVALVNMSFQQSAAEDAPAIEMFSSLELKEVPAVLLSECYNDMRAIAAAGSGYDPEWEKKTG